MYRFVLLSILLYTSLFKFVHLNTELCPYKELEHKVEASKYVDIEHANFVVAVIIWDEEYGFTYCTGSILNTTFVVTSGHCLMNFKCVRNIETRQFSCNQIEASNYDVVAGTNYIISPEKSLIKRVKRVLIHPSFIESGDYNFDVGLLELETPFVYSNKIGYRYVNNAIKLSYSNFIRGNNFRIYTYGNSPCSTVISPQVRKNLYMILTGEKFQRLQEIKVYGSDEIECQKVLFRYKEFGIIYNTNHVICGKILDVNPNCEDWAGSPVALANKENGAVLLAMFIQPITCETNNYVLFLRASALSSFITGSSPERFWQL